MCIRDRGTRFSDRVALNPKTFAKNATIIQIDIDPSELGKNVDMDLAIVGEVCYVLSGMLPFIEEKKHPDWMKMIHEWQAQDYPVSYTHLSAGDCHHWADTQRKRRAAGCGGHAPSYIRC